jgi:hypothetical protein
MFGVVVQVDPSCGGVARRAGLAMSSQGGEEILEFEGMPDDLDAVGLGLVDIAACSYVLGVVR